MSVAFRRDSDEEHREPRFEIPIPVGPNLVTPAGLIQIETRIAELVAWLAGESDKARLGEAERDLRYWRTRLATAQLVPHCPEGLVGFGSHVRFRLKSELRDMQIVGSDEADSASDRLSFSSPLARALLGSEKGDLVDFGGEAGVIEIVFIECTRAA